MSQWDMITYCWHGAFPLRKFQAPAACSSANLDFQISRVLMFHLQSWKFWMSPIHLQIPRQNPCWVHFRLWHDITCHFGAQKSTQFIPTAPHHVNMKLLVPVLVALAAIDCSVGSEAEEATRYVRSQSAGKVRGVAADEDRKLMFTTAAVDHKAPKQEHKPSSPSSPTYDHKPVTSPKDYPSPTHEVRRDRAMNRSAGTLRMTERHVARPNTITHSLSVTNLSVS